MYLQSLLILTLVSWIQVLTCTSGPDLFWLQAFSRNTFSKPTKDHFQGIFNSQNGPNLQIRNDPSSTPDAINRYVNNKCSPIQMHTERQAWAESDQLLRALGEWTIPI
jgi:hypothetical protein